MKVLFITWIDHFFLNSTEISSNGRLGFENTDHFPVD